MRAQLESFTAEMITEIKDLKDLTKKELPELAKEYINYNLKAAKIGIAFSVFGLIVTAILVMKIQAYTRDDFTEAFIYVIIASLISIFSLIGFISNVSEFMRFKYQPRRMAIRAITTLMNRNIR